MRIAYQSESITLPPTVTIKVDGEIHDLITSADARLWFGGDPTDIATEGAVTLLNHWLQPRNPIVGPIYVNSTAGGFVHILRPQGTI